MWDRKNSADYTLMRLSSGVVLYSCLAFVRDRVQNWTRLIGLFGCFCSKDHFIARHTRRCLLCRDRLRAAMTELAYGSVNLVIYSRMLPLCWSAGLILLNGFLKKHFSTVLLHAQNLAQNDNRNYTTTQMSKDRFFLLGIQFFACFIRVRDNFQCCCRITLPRKL